MRKMLIQPSLQYLIKNSAQDILNDLQHLNWRIPAVKSSESSFVGKVQRLVSPQGGSLRALIWELETLGKMPLSLSSFYAENLSLHIEDALIEAISKIVRINRHGLRSLSNDIEALTATGIAELGQLSKVKHYLGMLGHPAEIDDEENLFNLVTEEASLRLKFSQVERLLIQRVKLLAADSQENDPNGAAEDQSASTASSIYSYFGFSSSNAAQDYLSATSSDREAVQGTKLY